MKDNLNQIANTLFVGVTLLIYIQLRMPIKCRRTTIDGVTVELIE